VAKDTLTEQLEEIFENVNNWVKFAEAKNVALLTLNAAGIFGLLRLYGSFAPDAAWVLVAMLGAILLLFASLVICLVSFFARVRVSRSLFARPAEAGNLYFYNHIAEMEVDGFVDAVRDSMGYQGDVGKLHRDLANQIVVNSRIARKKYVLFNAALWVTLATIGRAGVLLDVLRRDLVSAFT